MRLQDWEETIQQILVAAVREPKDAGRQKMLMEWRAKLQQGSAALQPYEVDKIIREVQRRLAKPADERPSS